MKCFLRQSLRKIFSVLFVLSFSFQDACLYASNISVPAPVATSYSPLKLQALKIDHQNPFLMTFAVDPGSVMEDSLAALKRQLDYFMAALTIPEEDWWVNLSPDEPDRILPDSVSQTEFGKTLLEMDYHLKQITSQLMNPGSEIYRDAWESVYQKFYDRLGTVEWPKNFMGRVWIVPGEIDLESTEDSAVIFNSRLKVQLDHMNHKADEVVQREDVFKDIFTSTFIPVLEKEINEGDTFGELRSLYHAVILAKWLKSRIGRSVLGTGYIDKAKTQGIQLSDGWSKEKVFSDYLSAFRNQMSTFQERYDPEKQKIVVDKYVTGGLVLRMNLPQSKASRRPWPITNQAMMAKVDLQPIRDGFDQVLKFFKDYSGEMKVVRNLDVTGYEHLQIFEDHTGKKWLFKPHPETKEERALADDIVDFFAERAGLKSRVAAFSGRMGDRPGTFVEWFDSDGELSRYIYTYGRDFLQYLSREQLIQLVQEHVLDAYTAGHDSHSRNFLILNDGTLKGIDKSGAYQFVGDPEENISGTYNPNKKAFIVSKAVYEYLFEDLRYGRLKHLSLVEARQEAMKVVDKIESMSDEDYLRLFENYAELRFNVIRRPTEIFIQEKEEFLRLVLNRKKQFRNMLDKHYGHLRTQSNINAIRKNLFKMYLVKERDKQTRVSYGSGRVASSLAELLLSHNVPFNDVLLLIEQHPEAFADVFIDIDSFIFSDRYIGSVWELKDFMNFSADPFEDIQKQVYEHRQLLSEDHFHPYFDEWIDRLKVLKKTNPLLNIRFVSMGSEFDEKRLRGLLDKWGMDFELLVFKDFADKEIFLKERAQPSFLTGASVWVDSRKNKFFPNSKLVRSALDGLFVIQSMPDRIFELKTLGKIFEYLKRLGNREDAVLGAMDVLALSRLMYTRGYQFPMRMEEYRKIAEFLKETNDTGLKKEFIRTVKEWKEKAKIASGHGLTDADLDQFDDLLDSADGAMMSKNHVSTPHAAFNRKNISPHLRIIDSWPYEGYTVHQNRPLRSLMSIAVDPEGRIQELKKNILDPLIDDVLKFDPGESISQDIVPSSYVNQLIYEFLYKVNNEALPVMVDLIHAPELPDAWVQALIGALHMVFIADPDRLDHVTYFVIYDNYSAWRHTVAKELYSAKVFERYQKMADIRFLFLRRLLISQQQVDGHLIKEGIQSGYFTREALLRAYILNKLNNIVSQTSDLILKVDKHDLDQRFKIAEDLYPLAPKLAGLPFAQQVTIESFLEELGWYGITLDDLDQIGFQAYDGLIIPKIMDVILSTYRGSAEIDVEDARYLTHSVTTAIVHYANKGGEFSRKYGTGHSSSASGYKAYHEFDQGLINLLRDLAKWADRENSQEVALGFVYPGGGVVTKNDIEAAGLDWTDVSGRLIRNGWVNVLDYDSVRFRQNPNDIKDRLLAEFGDAFPELFPVFQKRPGHQFLEFTRKRTIPLKDKTIAELLIKLSKWQYIERRVEQNLLNIFHLIIKGAIPGDKISDYAKLIKSLIRVLEKRCGLNKAYFEFLFGYIDDEFYRDLVDFYHPDEDNRNFLRTLLHNALIGKKVLVKRERMDKPAIWGHHPWMDLFRHGQFNLEYKGAALTLLDYLEYERDMRQGTFEDINVEDEIPDYIQLSEHFSSKDFAMMEVESLRQVWDFATDDPSKHGLKSRYIVVGAENLPEVQEKFSNGVYYFNSPEGMGEAGVIEASYVASDRLQLRASVGFIVEVPSENLMSMYSYNAPPSEMDTRDIKSLLEEPVLMHPETLLAETDFSNKIFMVGRHPESGRSVKVVGAFIKKVNGRPEAPQDLWEHFQSIVTRLRVPLIEFESVSHQPLKDGISASIEKGEGFRYVFEIVEQGLKYQIILREDLEFQVRVYIKPNYYRRATSQEFDSLLDKIEALEGEYVEGDFEKVYEVMFGSGQKELRRARVKELEMVYKKLSEGEIYYPDIFPGAVILYDRHKHVDYLDWQKDGIRYAVKFVSRSKIVGLKFIPAENHRDVDVELMNHAEAEMMLGAIENYLRALPSSRTFSRRRALLQGLKWFRPAVQKKLLEQDDQRWIEQLNPEYVSYSKYSVTIRNRLYALMGLNQSKYFVFSPEKLLNFVKDLGFNDAYHSFVEENLTLAQHTLTIMNNFENFGFSDRYKGRDRLLALTRLAMVFHDKAKINAIEYGYSNLQHKFTMKIIHREMEAMGFSSEDINFVEALVTIDPIGYLLRHKITVDEAFQQIRSSAEKANLDIVTFFNMLTAYYISDAYSYPFLRQLFKVENGSAALRSEETRYYELKEKVNQAMMDKGGVDLSGINVSSAHVSVFSHVNVQENHSWSGMIPFILDVRRSVGAEEMARIFLN